MAINNDLFVGLTINNNISVGGNQVINNGGSDIAIIKYNPQGTIEWVKSYGGSEDESVSELFFDSGTVYFGGNTSGQGGSKTIGNLEVLNFSGFEERVFISYTFDDPTDGQLIIGGSENGGQNTEILLDNVKTISVIDVFPNPFTNELNVKINTETAAKVTLQLVSPIGQTLFENDYQASVGQNNFIINMGTDMPFGVYQLYVNGEDGTKSVHKVVKSKK